MREVSEELGQLPSRNPIDSSPAKNPITDYDVLAMDADGNLHAVWTVMSDAPRSIRDRSSILF